MAVEVFGRENVFSNNNLVITNTDMLFSLT